MPSCADELTGTARQDVQRHIQIVVPRAGPMERLNALIQSRPQSGAARHVRRDHDRLLTQMAAYEAAKLEEWCANIGDVSEQTLKQPLLRYVGEPHLLLDYCLPG